MNTRTRRPPPATDSAVSTWFPTSDGITNVRSAVGGALRSPGRPLDPGVRAKMDNQFGFDFSSVRVHDDSRAASSAALLHARAYTVGSDIVFGRGEYEPGTAEGTRVLRHELVHVMQGNGAATESGLFPSGVDEHTVFAGAPVGEGEHAHEGEARALSEGTAAPGTRAVRHRAASLSRLKLPTPIPICGSEVTDVDVRPARPRPLTECGLDPTIMVTRINVVGRRVTPASTGRGRIIFNLHVGYYRDPATGRLCGVISDSMSCLTPGGCIHLGCFPTLAEVLEAIGSALWNLLRILGVIALAIIVALILRGLRLPTTTAPAPAFAAAEESGDTAEESATV